MTALEIFRKAAPEFNSMTDEEVQGWFDFASPLVSSKRFGQLYNHALAYYAAHLIKLLQLQNDSSAASSVANLVVSEREGDLQRQYASPSEIPEDAVLLSTSYGRQFKDLAKRCRLPGVTRMNAYVESVTSG